MSRQVGTCWVNVILRAIDGFTCRTLACVGLIMLAACGGGGGGGPADRGDPGGDGGAAGRLAFTVDNAGRVAGYPLWASEGLLRLAHVIAVELDEARTSLGASSAGECGAHGSYVRQLVDHDDNGTLSTGDVLTLTYRRCSRFDVVRFAQGAATATVLSVDADGGVVAELALGAPGMGLEALDDDPRQVSYRVVGRARLELLRSRTRHGLVLGGGAADMLEIDISGSSFGPDRLTAFRLEKTHRWDEARTVLDLRMRYDSPELGGGFDMGTASPLMAWLDELPEPFAQQGQFRMLGRDGDLLRIVIVGGGWPEGELRLELDQRGDGRIDAEGTGRWGDLGLVAGFFFSDLTAGGSRYSRRHDPASFAMRRPFNQYQDQAIDSTWRVQFTRPPADTSAWRWRLIDRGRVPFGEGAAGEVPVLVQAQGALVIVQPAVPLRYSREYELLLDTGEAGDQGVLLRAATGGTLQLPNGLVLTVRTPDILNPRIGVSRSPATLRPGDSLVLSWFRLTGGDASAVAVRWNQLSGPSLDIENPGAQETEVRLSGQGTGVGAAIVQLTLTLADGSSESAEVLLRTVHDTQGAWVSRVQVPSPVLGSTTAAWEIWGGPEVGDLQVTAGDGALRISYRDKVGSDQERQGWTLILASAQGTVPGPGRYVQAWAEHAPERPAGVHRMEFGLNYLEFMPTDSEFEIFELDIGSGGEVTRLALDFVVRGVGDYTPTTGSLRLNSDRPLPP